MKNELSLSSVSEFAAHRNSDSNELVKRLAALSGEHAALTEKLRELHNKTMLPDNAQFKWHDLENQVVNLRCEMESFKQVF